MTAQQNFLRVLAWLAAVPSGALVLLAILVHHNIPGAAFLLIIADVGAVAAWALFCASTEADPPSDAELGPFAQRILGELQGASIRVHQRSEIVSLMILPSITTIGEGIAASVIAVLALGVGLGFTASELPTAAIPWVIGPLGVLSVIGADAALLWVWRRNLAPQRMEFSPETLRLWLGPSGRSPMEFLWRHIRDIRLSLDERQGMVLVLDYDEPQHARSGIRFGLGGIDADKFATILRDHQASLLEDSNEPTQEAQRGNGGASGALGLSALPPRCKVTQTGEEISITIPMKGYLWFFLAVYGIVMVVYLAWSLGHFIQEIDSVGVTLKIALRILGFLVLLPYALTLPMGTMLLELGQESLRLTPGDLIHETRLWRYVKRKRFQWEHICGWKQIVRVNRNPSAITFEYPVAPYLGSRFAIGYKATDAELPALLAFLQQYQARVTQAQPSKS